MSRRLFALTALAIFGSTLATSGTAHSQPLPPTNSIAINTVDRFLDLCLVVNPNANGNETVEAINRICDPATLNAELVKSKVFERRAKTEAAAKRTLDSKLKGKNPKTQEEARNTYARIVADAKTQFEKEFKAVEHTFFDSELNHNFGSGAPWELQISFIIEQPEIPLSAQYWIPVQTTPQINGFCSIVVQDRSIPLPVSAVAEVKDACIAIQNVHLKYTMMAQELETKLNEYVLAILKKRGYLHPSEEQEKEVWRSSEIVEMGQEKGARIFDMFAAANEEQQTIFDRRLGGMMVNIQRSELVIR